MSMYILSANVIYSVFTDKVHTIYIVWKTENASSDIYARNKFPDRKSKEQCLFLLEHSLTSDTLPSQGGDVWLQRI